MQDMLRVFIIRIACLNADHACLLLRPIISWVRDRISVSSSLPETDTYKVLAVYSATVFHSVASVFPQSFLLVYPSQVYRLLDFLSVLLEHPRAKVFRQNKYPC